MKIFTELTRIILSCFIVIAGFTSRIVEAQQLSSWHDSANKTAIISFVEKTTTVGSPDFIKPEERIAVFDNDGTLWSEQPIYFQLAFAIDRIKALAPKHPEWKKEEPFKSILSGDLKTALSGDMKNIAKIIMSTHAGMTTNEFEASVKNWISTAKHPKSGKLYTQMVYEPMLELLHYLRANGFKTYIVSGGGVDLMRAWSESVYGIPPEQVIGSRVNYKFEIREDNPVLLKLPELDLNDDGPNKPVGIQQVIGRRPVMAFGNSDGDLQMLQWTAAGTGPRFCLYVHHTDAEREWAYDRQSHIGKLDKGLDEARAKGWTVVDMKNDWKNIFPN